MKNKPITVYGTGEQSRCFLHVKDAVSAMIKLINSDKALGEVFNVGSQQEVTIEDLAKKIIKITNSKSGIVHLPPLKEGDMKRRYPDIAKMKLLLKRELIPIDEGIKKVLADKHFITSVL